MIGISMDDLEPIPSPVQEIGGKYINISMIYTLSKVASC